jgi:fucose 4-O-acetylase-like acetyltransferase
VVQNHIAFGASDGGSLTPAASWAASRLGFHVPFFLAAAFLFHPEITRVSIWIQKAKRLLIPFVAWGLLYTILRLLKIRLAHGTPWSPCDDPIGWIYSGGSVQLYFVPMLITGIAVASLVGLLISRQGARIYGGLGIISLVLYLWLFASGNAFDLGSMSAFVSWWGADQSWSLRTLGLILSWSVRLLPYILFVGCLRSLGIMALAHTRNVPLTLLCCGVFLLEEIGCFLPTVAHEILLGVSLLAASIAISAWISPKAWIQALGRWSFGIYLSHFLFVQLFKLVGVRLGVLAPAQLPLINILATTGLSYVASMVLMASAERWAPKWACPIFGLKYSRVKNDAGI